MKCVACAAPPPSPISPQGGAAHCRRSQRGRRPLGSLVGARGQNPLLPARDTGGEIPLLTDGRAPGTSYCGEIGFVAGRAVSFQITILKVLAGHPDGRASVTELTRYVSILMSSGPDWTDRMRRLAARTPKLEIFADGFVLREDRGWRITDSGRQFLASLEPAHAEENEQSSRPSVTVVTVPSQAQPTLRLVVDNTRTSQPDLGPDETRRSA